MYACAGQGDRQCQDAGPGAARCSVHPGRDAGMRCARAPTSMSHASLALSWARSARTSRAFAACASIARPDRLFVCVSLSCSFRKSPTSASTAACSSRTRGSTTLRRCARPSAWTATSTRWRWSRRPGRRERSSRRRCREGVGLRPSNKKEGADGRRRTGHSRTSGTRQHATDDMCAARQARRGQVPHSACTVQCAGACDAD